MKPICVPCKRFYRPEENGVAFVEGMPIGSWNGVSIDETRGNRAPERWKPYKLWMGDRWRCPDCGAEIIVGVGLEPVSEHYKTDFNVEMERRKPELQVNDC